MEEIEFIKKIGKFFQNSPIKVLVVNENYDILQANSMFSKALEPELSNQIQSTTASTTSSTAPINFLSLLSKDSKDIFLEYINKFNPNIINEPVTIDIKGQTLLLFVTPILEPKKKYFLFKLLNTKKYLSAENAGLVQLSRSVAHDVNNILTVINSLCDEMLARCTKNDSSYNDLLQVEKNVGRIADLIRQLFMFTEKQEEDNGQSITNITVCLVELAPMISRLANDNEIKLTINHSNAELLVNLSHIQLEQIIINMVINAINAMDRGGRLTISTELLKLEENFNNFDSKEYYVPFSKDTISPGEYVQINISDTGTGISSEIIHKIFDQSFSTKEEKVGTGIGLHTVYNILKQVNGFVRIKTAENKGTTFVVLLRRV